MAERWWTGIIDDLDEQAESNGIFRFDVAPWTYFVLRFRGRPGGAEVGRVRSTFLTAETSQGLATSLAGVVGGVLRTFKQGAA